MFFKKTKKVVLNNSIIAAYDVAKEIMAILFEVTPKEVQFRDLKIETGQFQSEVSETSLKVFVAGGFCSSWAYQNLKLIFEIRRVGIDWVIKRDSLIQLEYTSKNKVGYALHKALLRVGVYEEIILEKKEIEEVK